MKLAGPSFSRKRVPHQAVRLVASPSRRNLRTLALVLRLLATTIFLVGAFHLALGVRADVSLGADLSAGAITDPALDSQNRFYGVSFTLNGVLLLLCASNIEKYATVLRCVLWVFFAGGIARLASMAIHGVPPPSILVLLAVELGWINYRGRDGALWRPSRSARWSGPGS